MLLLNTYEMEHVVDVKILSTTNFAEEEHELSPWRAYFRLWSFASPLDLFLRLIGAGTAYLLMTLIFGSLVNAFNDRAVAHIASLAIARALLRKPEIPLLDDATSELNFESQIQVADAVRKVAKGGTMIHVTHRVGVMKEVDVVFVMERGRVVESGQYEELIASGGKLRDMMGEIVSQA